MAGARGHLGAGRSATELHEIIAAIHLNPGISTTALARMLDRRPRDVVYLASRARRWLGKTTARDAPFLPPGGHYRLHGITSDWLELVEHPEEESASESLIAALRLVQDRPLANIGDARWRWCEEWLEDTIDRIVNTAHTLAGQALASGDLELARWAVRRGRLADPSPKPSAATTCKSHTPPDKRGAYETSRRELSRLPESTGST